MALDRWFLFIFGSVKSMVCTCMFLRAFHTHAGQYSCFKLVANVFFFYLMPSQSYLTHSHQVEGLRGMLTIPASLESTSLVFAYGLDLFYTHTAPSKIYDSLTEDFSYALLLITIIALLVAIAVTYVLSERKELAEKWK